MNRPCDQLATEMKVGEGFAENLTVRLSSVPQLHTGWWNLQENKRRGKEIKKEHLAQRTCSPSEI